MSNESINYVRLRWNAYTENWYWTAVAHNGESIADGAEGIRLNYGDVEVRVVE